MTELFLFVRPPRPLWPFNGPASAVWPPLAFASLAAALRQNVRGLQVAILDAPALHMGWHSLDVELRRLQPSYVGIGEESVTCAEGLRLARLARDLKARVVAGGCFFAHVAEEALGTGLIDVVVHGEGEDTLVELVEALRSGAVRDLAGVAGISYPMDDSVIRTKPRALISDLDRLPFPAYDLLPVARYGQGSRNHPDLAAIELGRGCVGSCDFCVLWRQMGMSRPSGMRPHLRTKSPERLRAEIDRLTRTWQRRYLVWIDPCFNADPVVPGELARLLLRDNRRVGQSAWMRADGIVRDAASGTLRDCVQAGLNEVYLGIERSDSLSLGILHKTVDPGCCRRALKILARDFPEVFTVGSFIYGLDGDTPGTIRALHRFASELGLDHPFFVPLTPLPGTPFWHPEMWDPTGQKFRNHDFLPRPLRDGGHAGLERSLVLADLFCWNLPRLRSYLRGICHREARKRRLTRRLILRGAAFEARRLLEAVLGRTPAGGLYFPEWYES